MNTARKHLLWLKRLGYPADDDPEMQRLYILALLMLAVEFAIAVYVFGGLVPR